MASGGLLDVLSVALIFYSRLTRNDENWPVDERELDEPLRPEKPRGIEEQESRRLCRFFASVQIATAGCICNNHCISCRCREQVESPR
jgi:hypothetical protein